MNEDYLRSLKKSILDYVLLDPGEQNRLGIYPVYQVACLLKLVALFESFFQTPLSAGRETFPWHESVGPVREFLQENLFITHPAMLKLHQLWLDK